MPGKRTLQAMLADIEKRVGVGPPRWGSLNSAPLAMSQVRSRLVHRFDELERRPILNPAADGLFPQRAEQVIDFRLDHLGAKVESTARGDVVKGGPPPYLCNGPFVVLMRKRGETRPFLVIRIENDELLERWK
ncbi:MAG: hypothetical protein K2W96_24065 [Gemmataceae bacterium]|nr:hypothetical protein [Gemmataceae bacterium]